MKSNKVAVFSVLLLFSGCRGTAPARNSLPTEGMSAVLIQSRLFLPSGEIREGRTTLNLESDSHIYRVDLPPKETLLLLMKPGFYHFAPTRGIFGSAGSDWPVNFNGRLFRAPVPESLLKHAPILLEPGVLLPLGTIEARLKSARQEEPEISIHLEEDIQSRRNIVSGLIQKIMDPNASPEFRDFAVQWSIALEHALLKLQKTQDPPHLLAPPP